MKKLILSVTVFMFVLGSTGVAFAQDPVKTETEQTENKQEAEEAKEKEEKAATEDAKSEEPAKAEEAAE